MRSLPLDLLERYREPVPRYTSYPAVMHWRAPPAVDTWTRDLAATLAVPDARLSLYVHIPFCQSLCSFCGCNVRIVRNHALAEPYVDTLLREFALYRERLPGVPLRLGELHLGGGTPTFLPAGALDRLLDGLLEHCTVAPGADLAIEADPRNTTREQLVVLRRHGFKRLSLGVQDFDPRVQEIVGRVHDAQMVRRVVDLARELAIGSISLDLIHGLPLQTPESLAHTFDTVATLRPDRIAFLPYAHVPWIKSSQRQYTEADLPEPRVRSQLFAVGRQSMADMGMVEIGMDQYARGGDPLAIALADHSLHRNFMGFTVSHTDALVGLGVSALGHGRATYVQNEKSLQQYEARLASGELPLQRGHAMSPDDLRIRGHLWNLMCASRTQLTAAERELAWWHLARDRLLVAHHDGLVKLEASEIGVTQTGRVFLRQICAAIDPWQQLEARQMTMASA
jgi:oxygen-independent coproporphyrinogen III oxidase